MGRSGDYGVNPPLCQIHIQLLRQLHRPNHREGGIRFCIGILGLRAAEGQGVLSGQDGAVALVVNAGHRAGIDGGGDFHGGFLAVFTRLLTMCAGFAGCGDGL